MRIRTISFVLLTAVLAGKAAGAAQAGIQGPVLGFVFDSAMGAIRPINGILGSSMLGQPLDLPFPVAAAVFSPRGDFALTVSASSDQTARVLRNLGGTNDSNSIDGAISGADGVFLNADASAGILLSSGAQMLQVVRGLPESPVAGVPVDLSSISGTISAVAIDQAGANVLIAVTADHGALYLVAAEQVRPARIADLGSPTALALLDGDQDVIVADGAVNELTLIRNFAGAPEAFHLAGERDGVAGPAGLRMSADGRKLYVADHASRTLDIWNFDSQSVEASYPLDVSPTRLTALQGSSTFLLNDVGDHPLLLLDAINPAVYFVPAAKNQQ
jgi:DNA-binding beta-propeller fold protein YncE